MTIAEADRAMDRLTGYYPGRDLPPQTQVLYLAKLGALGYEGAVEAIDRAADEWAGFPPWAVLRRHYDNVRAELRARALEAEVEVWVSDSAGDLVMTSGPGPWARWAAQTVLWMRALAWIEAHLAPPLAPRPHVADWMTPEHLAVARLRAMGRRPVA